jgi:hypothetical protein
VRKPAAGEAAAEQVPANPNRPSADKARALETRLDLVSRSMYR